MFLLITGASGTGKSSVRSALAPALEPEVVCVELHADPEVQEARLRGRSDPRAAAAPLIRGQVRSAVRSSAGSWGSG